MTTLIPAIGLISLTDEHRGWLEERYAFVYAPDAAARRAAITLVAATRKIGWP